MRAELTLSEFQMSVSAEFTYNMFLPMWPHNSESQAPCLTNTLNSKLTTLNLEKDVEPSSILHRIVHTTFYNLLIHTLVSQDTRDCFGSADVIVRDSVLHLALMADNGHYFSQIYSQVMEEDCVELMKYCRWWYWGCKDVLHKCTSVAFQQQFMRGHM